MSVSFSRGDKIIHSAWRIGVIEGTARRSWCGVLREMRQADDNTSRQAASVESTIEARNGSL